MAESERETYVQSPWNSIAAGGAGLCDFKHVPQEHMHRHTRLLPNSACANRGNIWEAWRSALLSSLGNGLHTACE